MTYRCNKCALCSKRRSPVYGRGLKNADLAVVGESPDKLGVELDDVFIGEAGGLLNWMLQKSGLLKQGVDRYSKMYITNVLKCYPARDDLSDSIDITVDMKATCRPLLSAELRAVKPKYIIALGSHAIQTLSNNYRVNITDCAGYWEYNGEYDAWVMPILHPAYVLRNWGATSRVLNDFRSVSLAIKDGGVTPYSLGDYSYVTNVQQAKALFSELESSRFFIFDLETTALEYWKEGEEILGVSFSTQPGKAAWLPFYKTGEHGRQAFWSPRQFTYLFGRLKKVMEDKAIKKGGQNVKFDILWLRSKGIVVRGVAWDTMQVHHIIDENTPADLTYLNVYYRTGLPNYAQTIAQYLNKEKKYEYVPSDILAKYAAADADGPFRIFSKQRKIASPAQIKLYRTLGAATSKFAAEMEYRGALVDVPRISVLEAEYEEKIDVKGKVLAKIVKAKSFNAGSPQQVGALLFDTLKLPVIKKTKAKKRSVDKETMEELRRKFPSKVRVIKIIGLIEEIRKMKKMKSTYLTGFRKLVDKNNRLHTSYHTTGTVTTRLASSKPNLQNIPRDPLFRSLFVAGDGRKLVVADYKQIEAKLLAFLSNEVSLVEKFADNDFDIHMYNASVALQKDQSDVTKEERSVAKSITFGMNYGRSIGSIAKEYELEFDYVEDFVNAYFEGYKGIKAFRDRQVRISKDKLFVLNAYGCRRNFSAYEWIYSKELAAVQSLRKKLGAESYILEQLIGNIERQAINFPIQSYASNILSFAIDRIRRALRKARLDAYVVLNIHDAVITESAIECVEEVKKIVDTLMPITKQLKNGTKMFFGADVSVEDYWVQ